MSELRSAIEAFRVDSLPGLPDARLEEDFAEIHRAVEALEVERLRRLAEIDRRCLFERDGHLTTAAWLVAGLRMAWGRARALVRLARSLEHMSGAQRALKAGNVSVGTAAVLADARSLDPDAYARDEHVLVDAATRHGIADLHRVVGHWRQAVERDPENGETVLTALRAVLDGEARSGSRDERTPAQRRADALGEICRHWLDGAERPSVAGDRPHLTITVPAETLAGGESAELDHVGPVSSVVARQLACDGSIQRVVMSARSEPLDVGRRTPVVSAAMRRAVIVRDRHCRFPGCDRPHTWCDAHHVVHWVDGGQTAVQNLLLLCRRHHRKVHERGGFRLELVQGRPVFRRPDGSVLADRAPP